jgi:hypothetical protein
MDLDLGLAPEPEPQPITMVSRHFGIDMPVDFLTS